MPVKGSYEVVALASALGVAGSQVLGVAWPAPASANASLVQIVLFAPIAVACGGSGVAKVKLHAGGG